MLTSLYIENLAVIEKTTILFKEGFNVLTGETGAGKSILIGAINAALGQRVTKDIIRAGKTSAIVIATFDEVSLEIKNELQEMGISVEDDTIIIQREISLNGKSNCRINLRPTTLSFLKHIAHKLINIHGQHESYDLFSQDKHLAYLDNYARNFEHIQEYDEVYVNLRKVKNEINKLKSDDLDRSRKIDLLKYQIEEIDNANLKIGEDSELNEQKNIANNSEKIKNSLTSAYDVLTLNAQNNVISLLRECSYEIDALKDYLPQIENVSQRLNDCFYELQDCSFEISSILEENEETYVDIDYVNERLNLIYKLLRKYGDTIEDVLIFCDKCKGELDILSSYEFNMEKLNIEYNKLLKQASILAKALSEKRMKASFDFSKRVKEEMTFLNMPNVMLRVEFERTSLTKQGCDKAEFLFSTNPGQPLKPVSKIASGGELSRMMLAIKAVLSEVDEDATLIFDEIDTGISGSAAQKVGLKLKEVSKNKQVICVTHQPQIASLADAHFLIKKNVENNNTFTNIEELDFEQRKYEIARIISGEEITDVTLKHAEEMLTGISE